MSFTPHDLEFVFLSFEGPDQPYAQAAAGWACASPN